MWGVATVYLGLTLAAVGFGLVIKPLRRLRVSTRWHAAAIFGCGVLLVGVGLFLPVTETHVAHAETRLDDFAPSWQFREVHTRRIAAPPAQVFSAIKEVRADEITFFQTLTWIRRGGQASPPGILNPGTRESLIDVATRTGFLQLAEEIPRELVIGAVVVAPPGTRGRLTPEVFQKTLPPGFALAMMNFLVIADGPTGSQVTTETRVFVNSPAARRRFAAYWRVIYPGSAIIRRMWLRAIERRATAQRPS